MGDLKIWILATLDAIQMSNPFIINLFWLQLFKKDFFKLQSTIIHEFIHALGLYHVQSREDRDKYVEIKWDNIKEKTKHNFKKHKGSRTFGVPYDPLSIMHYGYNAFCKDCSKPTIVSKVNFYLCYFASVWIKSCLFIDSICTN